MAREWSRVDYGSFHKGFHGAEEEDIKFLVAVKQA